MSSPSPSPTPKELGWTESKKGNGTTVYVCQGEETSRMPQIPCDLPQGWEHVRSRSKGTTYYKCAAGNNGQGITQWSIPTSPCDATTQATKKNSSKSAVPPPSATEKVTVIPNAASGAIHVNVTTLNGTKKGFNVTPAQTPSQGGGKHRKTRRNKNKSRKNKNRNRKNKKTRSRRT